MQHLVDLPSRGALAPQPVEGKCNTAPQPFLSTGTEVSIDNTQYISNRKQVIPYLKSDMWVSILAVLAVMTSVPAVRAANWTGDEFCVSRKEFNLTAAILGSVLGIMVLYYGGWGIYYLWQWWEARVLKQEEELENMVNHHDKKLQQKFVKADKSSTPHTSKMRENFSKQFGYTPSQDEVKKGEASDGSVTTVTNLSAGMGNANPSGGYTRTLATRLPGSKASKSSDKKGNYARSPSASRDVDDFA